MLHINEERGPAIVSRESPYYAIFKRRGILLAPVLVLLVVWPWWECEPRAWVWAVGLVVFAVGVALRTWAQRHLKYRMRQGRWLSVTGPYAWTRNPVYIGNLLVLAGLCVLCRLPWLIPVVCGWAFLVYHCCIRFEEQRLAEAYGDEYPGYVARVPRWWPRRPAGKPEPLTEIAGWRRAVSVEWHSALMLLIPVVKELLHPYM